MTDVTEYEAWHITAASREAADEKASVKAARLEEVGIHGEYTFVERKEPPSDESGMDSFEAAAGREYPDPKPTFVYEWQLVEDEFDVMG